LGRGLHATWVRSLAAAVAVGRPAPRTDSLPLGLKVVLGVGAAAIVLAIALMVIWGPPEMLYPTGSG
jgi:hypothetical protein